MIFLASTNPKEDYIAVLAETDYFEDLKHGWEYTLSHLIEQYKHEVRTVSSRIIRVLLKHYFACDYSLCFFYNPIYGSNICSISTTILHGCRKKER